MKHRIPFASVFYLAVDGEAQLHCVQIVSGGCGTFGGPTTPMHGPGYMPSAGHHHTHMPGIPPGPVPQYGTAQYGAYPGQTHNSPYLQVV